MPQDPEQSEQAEEAPGNAPVIGNAIPVPCYRRGCHRSIVERFPPRTGRWSRLPCARAIRCGSHLHPVPRHGRHRGGSSRAARTVARRARLLVAGVRNDALRGRCNHLRTGTITRSRRSFRAFGFRHRRRLCRLAGADLARRRRARGQSEGEERNGADSANVHDRSFQRALGVQPACPRTAAQRLRDAGFQGAQRHGKDSHRVDG